MSKLKKFLKNPLIFTRDFLNNRFPFMPYELPVSEKSEQYVYEFCDFLEQKMSINKTDDFPVDLVFTWAGNGSMEKIKKYLNCKSSNTCDFADNPARFADNDELKFALKSVLDNMDWIRKIYIITDNEIPKFISNNKIEIIDHKEIIDNKYLPTFNSHVIEAHLHKIDNLSENFIYLNDDVIIARELCKGHFFQGNGIANLFISNKSLQDKLKKSLKEEQKTATLWANENSLKLLKSRYFNSNFDSILIHSGKSLKKSAFELAWNLWKKEIKEFLPNKFRSKNDLNLAAFLVPYLMYAEGQATIYTELCDYFDIATPVARTHYKNLLNKKNNGFNPHSLCLNCVKLNIINKEKYQETSEKFLQNYHNKIAGKI